MAFASGFALGNLGPINRLEISKKSNEELACRILIRNPTVFIPPLLYPSPITKLV